MASYRLNEKKIDILGRDHLGYRGTHIYRMYSVKEGRYVGYSFGEDLKYHFEDLYEALIFIDKEKQKELDSLPDEIVG